MQRQPDHSFQYLRHLEDRTMEFQLGMAKWVMVTSVLINGSAMVALISAAKEYPAAAGHAGPFVAGVIFGLLSGLFAWLSTASTNEAITDRIDWENLTVHDPPSADRWDRWATGFAVCAVVSVLLSIGGFGLGAWRVQDSIARSGVETTSTVSFPTQPHKPVSPPAGTRQKQDS